jgi:hypothetical protein
MLYQQLADLNFAALQPAFTAHLSTNTNTISTTQLQVEETSTLLC